MNFFTTSITAGDERRVGQQCFAALHVHKARGAVEVEVQFHLVEHMEERHVVTADAQVLEGVFEFGRLDEEVRADDDEGALGDLLSGVVQGFENGGLAFGFQIGELIKDEPEVRCAAFRREFLAVIFTHAPQADGIALLCGEIAERAREFAAVVQPRCARRPVGHRTAAIHNEREPEVRVGFEFLDVKTIRATPRAPVETAGVVAGDVFAVLGKLDGRSADGTAVAARDTAYHRLARVQRQREKAREDFAV